MRRVGVAITAATPEDAATLAALLIDFETYLHALLRKKKRVDRAATVRAMRRGLSAEPPLFCAMIAREKGAAVGYGLYHVGFDTEARRAVMYIEDVYVAPSRHRRGVGRKLMAALNAEAKKLRCVALRWTVWNRNPAALAFYLSIGGTPADNAILMGMKVSARG